MPQYEFASKSIDLVVQDGGRMLAVECDGDQWHGSDRYDEDTFRQRQLERCGWEFFRVRESAFYANRIDALAGLWPMLEARDILPRSHSVAATLQTDSVEVSRENRNGDPRENGDVPDDIGIATSEMPADRAKRAGQHQLEFPLPLEDSAPQVRRRAEDVSASEIQDAILHVLANCPKQTCTLKSLTSRVLKEVEVTTRGKPRADFERRVKRNLTVLEKRDRIERYKAKNQRVRLR